jgi:hypothetical protein
VRLDNVEHIFLVVPIDRTSMMHGDSRDEAMMRVLDFGFVPSSKE